MGITSDCDASCAEMITYECDGTLARFMAAGESSRIGRIVSDLHASGQHTAAELLTRAAESADLDADTWGAAYLALRKVGR